MGNTQFQKTLVDTIKDFLDTDLPKGYFKMIFYGDPMNIPSSLLPCISINKVRTAVTAGPTGMDRVVSTIVIALMYNKKDDFGQTTDEVTGKRKLEEFAEARINSTDNNQRTWAAISVMGILRHHFTLGNVVLNQDHDINYGVVPRPGNEMTAEAQIKVSFTELVPVPLRD